MSQSSQQAQKHAPADDDNISNGSEQASSTSSSMVATPPLPPPEKANLMDDDAGARNSSIDVEVHSRPGASDPSSTDTSSLAFGSPSHVELASSDSSRNRRRFLPQAEATFVSPREKACHGLEEVATQRRGVNEVSNAKRPIPSPDADEVVAAPAGAPASSVQDHNSDDEAREDAIDDNALCLGTSSPVAAAVAPPIVTRSTRRQTFGSTVNVSTRRRSGRRSGSSVQRHSSNKDDKQSSDSNSDEEDDNIMIDMFSPPPSTTLRTRPRSHGFLEQKRNEEPESTAMISASGSLAKTPCHVEETSLRDPPPHSRRQKKDPKQIECSYDSPPTVYEPQNLHLAGEAKTAVAFGCKSEDDRGTRERISSSAASTKPRRRRGLVVHVPKNSLARSDSREASGANEEVEMANQEGRGIAPGRTKPPLTVKLAPKSRPTTAMESSAPLPSEAGRNGHVNPSHSGSSGSSSSQQQDILASIAKGIDLGYDSNNEDFTALQLSFGESSPDNSLNAHAAVSNEKGEVEGKGNQVKQQQREEKRHDDLLPSPPKKARSTWRTKCSEGSSTAPQLRQHQRSSLLDSATRRQRNTPSLQQNQHQHQQAFSYHPAYYPYQGQGWSTLSSTQGYPQVGVALTQPHILPPGAPSASLYHSSHRQPPQHGYQPWPTASSTVASAGAPHSHYCKQQHPEQYMYAMQQHSPLQYPQQHAQYTLSVSPPLPTPVRQASGQQALPHSGAKTPVSNRRLGRGALRSSSSDVRTPGSKRKGTANVDITVDTAESSCEDNDFDGKSGPISPPSSKKKKANRGASAAMAEEVWGSPPRGFLRGRLEREVTAQQATRPISQQRRMCANKGQQLQQSPRRHNQSPRTPTSPTDRTSFHELQPTPITDIFPAESWSPSAMQSFFDEVESPDAGLGVGNGRNPHHVLQSATGLASPAQNRITIRGSPISRNKPDGKDTSRASATAPAALDRLPERVDSENANVTETKLSTSARPIVCQTPSNQKTATGMHFKIGAVGGMNSVLRGSPVEASSYRGGLQQNCAHPNFGVESGDDRTLRSTSMPPSARVGTGKENVNNDHIISSSSSTAQPCNCKKSKCLKLYCECFSAERFCNGCKCTDCHNTPAYASIRNKAIADTKAKNPHAFKQKMTGQNASHAMGCRCKKSACLKKYCECFQAGIVCCSKCKCVNCKNFVGSQALIDRRRKIKDHKGAEIMIRSSEKAWKGNFSDTKLGARSAMDGGLAAFGQSLILHDPTTQPFGPQNWSPLPKAISNWAMMSPLLQGKPQIGTSYPGMAITDRLQQPPTSLVNHPPPPHSASRSEGKLRQQVHKQQPSNDQHLSLAALTHKSISVERAPEHPGARASAASRVGEPTIAYFGAGVEAQTKTVILSVFSYLDHDDLFCASIVSKKWCCVFGEVVRRG